MDAAQFCSYTYQFSMVPIYSYHGDKLKFSYHSGEECFLPPNIILRQSGGPSHPITIYETSVNSYYGRIQISDQEFLLLGPVSPFSYTQRTVRRFLLEYDFPYETRNACEKALHFIPTMPLLQFTALLKQLYCGLTGNDPAPLLTDEVPQKLAADTLADEYVSFEMNTREEEYHNTLYENWRNVLPLIENGDLEGLLRYGGRMPPFRFGRFSDHLREQQLVVLIISVVSALYAAIQGGMAQQAALALAEMYIQKGIKLSSPAEIDEISMHAILDFTRRVREERDIAVSHSPVYRCVQFIRENIYNRCSVKEVADYSGYSLGHFSRLFKQDMGITPNRYITHLKLYEAEKLLRSTDLPIAEISFRLHFANQSHFHRQFKARYHCTPFQYRSKSHLTKPQTQYPVWIL